MEFAGGTKSWYINNKLHREDGPAIEYANGDKRWYYNDKIHRIDGPAIERINGTKCWYLNDKKYSEEEFLKRVNQTGPDDSLASCEGKVVEIDGKKYKLIEV